MSRPATVALAGGFAVVALGFDALDARHHTSVLATGLYDEPAHFAFTALWLVAVTGFRRVPTTFLVAALVASVVIDLDHLPYFLGVGDFAATPDGRPYSHSVATVLVVLVVAAISARARIAAMGAGFGLVAHLVRDVYEGAPGVSLLWPVTPHAFLGTQTGFRLAVAAGVGMAAIAALRRPGAGSRAVSD